MRDGDGDARCIIAQKPPSDRAARARPGSTKATAHVADAAAVGECPLCTRSFADNDELNAHIDWCLSREAIRSAQVEGDGRTKERRKLEVGVRQPKEWWKGGSVEEGAGQNRKPKRRKL
jgi:DNA polymerase kappa